MKFDLICLTCAVVCFSGCFARIGLKNKNKETAIQAGSTQSPVTPSTSSVVSERRTQVEAATSPMTRRPLRLSQMNHAERKCCKVGHRASKKGFFCNLDMFYASRFTNMEHNMKMKFQIKPVSKKAKRFVNHMERWCVKTGLKSIFYKCCETA